MSFCQLEVASNYNQNFSKLAIAAMRKLKVLKMYECSLVRYDDKSHRLLKACEPYVTWGAPDVRTIRELITKRGHALKKVLFAYLLN